MINSMALDIRHCDRAILFRSTCEMDHSDMRKKKSNMTWGISKNVHGTLHHLRGDMVQGNISDRGQHHFLNSTCDMGVPSIKGPNSLT